MRDNPHLRLSSDSKLDPNSNVKRPWINLYLGYIVGNKNLRNIMSVCIIVNCLVHLSMLQVVES